MGRLSDTLSDPRRWLCYGGGLLLIAAACAILLLNPSPKSPPLPVFPDSSPAPASSTPRLGSRGPFNAVIVLYVAGFLLLLAGGRSESEKRGYHF